jgi:hypothetical protein
MATRKQPNADKWWKLVLLYPTLVIAIISAIPTYVELIGSSKLGVPFGNYRAALKENELWKENIECAAAPFAGLANPNNVEVDAVVCLSGNVLVRIKPPQREVTYKWVPLDVAAKQASEATIVRAALAASDAPKFDLAQNNYRVICQLWIANGLLLRRVQRPNNTCFDETVNTFTGQVVRTVQVPCNPQCGQ